HRGARANILSDLTHLLSDFKGYFAPAQEGFDLIGPVAFDISEGQATFIRKTYAVDSEGSVIVYENKNKEREIGLLPSNFHYIRFTAGNKKFVVVNLHGVSR